MQPGPSARFPGGRACVDTNRLYRRVNQASTKRIIPHSLPPAAWLSHPIARGEARVLDYHVSDEDPASPEHQRMPVVFGDVQQASLRGEDLQVDSAGFPRDGWRAKIGLSSTPRRSSNWRVVIPSAVFAAPSADTSAINALRLYGEREL